VVLVEFEADVVDSETAVVEFHNFLKNKKKIIFF
jgi:hypothetical protein